VALGVDMDECLLEPDLMSEWDRDVEPLRTGSCRAVWAVANLDFLELSIVADMEQAE
jgi:hypothetical protein